MVSFGAKRIECQLTGYPGIKGLIISQESSTVNTPRAHYTNNATFGMRPHIFLSAHGQTHVG